MRLDIEAITESHECETCGTCYATGWLVKKDGELWFELVPAAHCYGGADYSEIDMMTEVVARLLPKEYVTVNVEY